MTRPAQLPAYPDFTGREPCTADPSAFYGSSEEASRPDLALIRQTQAKELCSWCPMQVECLEWGIYRERYGIWGGTTEAERAALRRRAGIVLVTLEAEWNRDHIIRMARTRALTETGT